MPDYDYEFTTVHVIPEQPHPQNSDGNRKTGGENTLYYGVPGSGKSHEVDRILTQEKIPEEFVERVVFHPDYSYSDFVGQILPTIKKMDTGDEKLVYDFEPGPFTLLLKKAENTPTQACYLVIEELNRGNAPAIFGDLFQLLDRTSKGESKYGVTNSAISKELVKGIAGKTYDPAKKVKIPSNMWILATMNTSDQNVFTLDTAFQRRWHMTLIINDFNKASHADNTIQYSKITWRAFATVVNDLIVDPTNGLASSEDKRLGAFFATKDELTAARFSHKVLKYLWDDAFKMNRDVFADKMSSFDDVVLAFKDTASDPLSRIFREDIYTDMLNKSGSLLEVATQVGEEE